MKKIALPILLIACISLMYSCSSSRLGSYRLTEADAASAIRQMLALGVEKNNFAGAFSKDAVLSTLFPEPIKKVLTTLNTLGLTGEIDRFTTTLSTAAEKTATTSAPIFISSINRIGFTDATRIIKAGGTSATDYLRTSVGDSIRRAITPVVEQALQEYKLNEQWQKAIEPVKGVAGNKLNLDLTTVMSGLVTEAMFRKIAEKEVQVRSEATARTTNLLQKVFSRSWQ